MAKRNEGNIAFIDRTSDRRITFRKALIAALIISRKLRDAGKGYIGILLPTSSACALSILGSLMIGRTPVMINYSTGAHENTLFAKRKCSFSTIITARAFLEKINCEPVDGMVFIEDIMGSVTFNEKITAAITALLPLPVLLRMVHGGRPDDDAVILFTSGSEKEPKGVQLTHRNILSNVKSICSMIEVYDKDVILANLPYFHVLGFTVTLWLPIYVGANIVFYANPLEYKTIATIIREERPTIMIGTPSFLSGYVRKSDPGDFTSLRIVMCGADKCPEALRQEYLDKHGITVFEGYGTTETSPVISVNLPGSNKPGSVGKVVANARVKIENYDTGDDCKPNDVGRILVKGDLVMKGYFDEFEETSMRVRHGWYDTGDMGYLDEDGYLWHAGRLKRFVKIGGEMVSLVRVEIALERLLPEGVECCVVEVPDLHKGARIIAAVTKHLDERKTLKQMAESLPKLALPKQFIVMEELPKMGSGKIDFRTVTAMVNEQLAIRVKG